MSKSKTLLCSIALTASGLLAQAPGPPVLLHLYPVALDANGQPLTDLAAGDFKIVDQGKPQTIFAFRKPAVAPAAPLAPLEFSNRPGGAMPHSTVILFDMINENQADRLDNWKELDKSLPQLESGENVYFYVLNLEGVLTPIHGFGPKSPDDKTWPKDVASVLDKVMKAASHARPVQSGQEDEVKKTYKALEDLGSQLASLPGRGDIVWITNGVQNVYNTKHPCNGDWVECALYVPHLGVTLEKEGAAVNPLCYSRDLNPDVNRDLEQMALLTGGHAYFREDIRAVLKQVFRNAMNSYSIAYDPSADNWDNKFHKIRISCERAGVKLQVRERYYALPDTRPATDRMKAAMMAAFQSPSDMADIGLRTKIAPMEGDKKGVHLDIRINPSDVLLHEQGGKFSGALYLLISDRSASAPLGEPAVLNLNPELTAEQHDAVMKEGLPLAQDHPITDTVAQVRIIVLDQNTNAVGSLTFPVK
jgi:VWFA-related protein